MTNTIRRIAQLAVGVAGSAVFLLAVLCALAVPAASADADPACFPQPGDRFSRCDALDLARVDDLRVAPNSAEFSCLVARGFRTEDEAGSPWAAGRPPGQADVDFCRAA